MLGGNKPPIKSIISSVPYLNWLGLTYSRLLGMRASDLQLKIMEHNIFEECGQLLAKNKLTIACAESATAGQLTAAFSLCEQSGNFLMGGLSCYDASIKEKLLGVSPQLIETCTPESEEVTFAMTTGLMALISADIHLGITGLTRPGGSETAEKPVGTMFFCGMFGENKLFEERKVFQGNPKEIVDQTVVYAAQLLKNAILQLRNTSK